MLIERGTFPCNLVLAACKEALPLGLASHLLLDIEDAAAAARHALALYAIVLEDLMPLHTAVFEQSSCHLVIPPFYFINRTLKCGRIQRV